MSHDPQKRSLYRLFQLKLLFFHICLRYSRKIKIRRDDSYIFEIIFIENFIVKRDFKKFLRLLTLYFIQLISKSNLKEQYF